jgi:ABC-type transport system involved in multi-copper enzyme maturation permease subunit
MWLLKSWQAGVVDWDHWELVVGVNGGLGLMWMVLAVVQLRGVVFADRHHPPHFFLLGDAGLRWRPRVGRWPIIWKELFTQPMAGSLDFLARAVVAIIGGGALVWMMWALVVSPPPGGNATPFQVFALLVEPPLVCIGLLMVVVRAATGISGERDRLTWDSLAVSPTPGGEIVIAKFLGALAAARWVWALAGLLLALGAANGQLQTWGVVRALFLAVALAGAAGALGTMASIRCRTSLGALGVALGASAFASVGYLLLVSPAFLVSPGPAGPPVGLLVPCVSAVLMLAMVAAVQGLPNLGEVGLVCTASSVAYAAAGVILLAMTWQRFDRWMGRSLPPKRRAALRYRQATGFGPTFPCSGDGRGEQ